VLAIKHASGLCLCNAPSLDPALPAVKHALVTHAEVPPLLLPTETCGQLLSRHDGRLLHFTAPLSIESTLWFVCSSMISLAFVGHLGSQPLAACVLANSVYNISGYSLVVGMAAGMNSLSGQVGHARGHAQAIPATAAWVLRARCRCPRADIWYSRSCKPSQARCAPA